MRLPDFKCWLDLLRRADNRDIPRYTERVQEEIIRTLQTVEAKYGSLDEKNLHVLVSLCDGKIEPAIRNALPEAITLYTGFRIMTETSVEAGFLRTAMLKAQSTEP